MRPTFSLAFCLVFSGMILNAQKKPLDHSVYDNWQRIGERMISNDGKWVVYTVDPQEGDNELVIQSSDAKYKKTVARGYNAVITEDSRFAIFRIKPFFRDTRDAKIKKKKADEMPKDSFAIVELGKDSVWKVARVKGYKTPEKEAGWVAYQLEKSAEKKDTDKKKPESADKKIADSLTKVIDSLQQVIQSTPAKKKKKQKDEGNDVSVEDDSLLQALDSPITTHYSPLTPDAEGDDPAAAITDAGTDLVLRNLENGQEKIFNNVLEYYFSKKGGKLVVEQGKNPKDSLSKVTVTLYDLKEAKATVLSNSGNEFKNFTFSEDGSQLAYLAERDARPKELQKFYKLWYYKTGMDSAALLADKNSVGMILGMTVSEYGNLNFSKSGNRLFFGTAPIQPPKDTTLVEMDLVKLDVWHYKDDYLQTQQLYNLQRELQKNYLAVYHLDKQELKQLASVEVPTVFQTNEGDGDQFVGITDMGNRVESQWTGNTKKDIYAINVNDGSKRLVKKDLLGVIMPQYISPTGKYIMWYDSKARNYFAWDGTTTRNLTEKIKYPLWIEENDMPDDPRPYGIAGWYKDDSMLFVYDKYDIWRIGFNSYDSLTKATKGRDRKISYRYLRVDPEEKYIDLRRSKWIKGLKEDDKSEILGKWILNSNGIFGVIDEFRENIRVTSLMSDKLGHVFIVLKESYTQSPNIYSTYNLVNSSKGIIEVFSDYSFSRQLSDINPQQKDYNWGTAELYKWKAFNGKMSEGVLYKPEDFNPKKKYPLLMYFYETHSDELNTYIPPTPTGSRLNISFFVSRGYVVFCPDIRYTNGHPAKSCYDYVVSAAQDLARQKWIDAKNIGIQGQSWGGIQVAQLITMTDMFKAAWAGAPVANMTSAYGGIRWESGVNRQFQYEKSQSRIGATLWEKPELYIENSPLFHLPKVKTPLVIMANDADGAVPWYQGIELFTAMRRLGKQVWMLNYNGEAHNLVERKNRKDIQIREQQYFDWLLKGAKPPRWITEGVPATKKGKDWGLELVD